MLNFRGCRKPLLSKLVWREKKTRHFATAVVSVKNGPWEIPDDHHPQLTFRFPQNYHCFFREELTTTSHQDGYVVFQKNLQ